MKRQALTLERDLSVASILHLYQVPRKLRPCFWYRIIFGSLDVDCSSLFIAEICVDTLTVLSQNMLALSYK